MTQNAIKYFVIFAMLLNHIAAVFLDRGTLLHEIFTDIGYFTAVTMCYFLAEGYRYTHSKRSYAARLFVFAIVSELPFCLAFSETGALEFVGWNMIFTLLICFLILCVFEYNEGSEIRFMVISILLVATYNSDWAFLAPVFTLMFHIAYGDRRRVAGAYVIAAFLFGIENFVNAVYEYTIIQSIGIALIRGGVILLAGVIVLFFYNGQRGERSWGSKWIFYIFYPLHLLILGVIRIWCF